MCLLKTVTGGSLGGGGNDIVCEMFDYYLNNLMHMYVFTSYKILISMLDYPKADQCITISMDVCLISNKLTISVPSTTRPM